MTTERWLLPAGLASVSLAMVVSPALAVAVGGLWAALWALVRFGPRASSSVGRVVVRSLFVLVVALLVAQVVPYGRTHGNPDVRLEPVWVDARTRDLAVAACFDCHSNETRWPWYTDIAPLSWWITNHVDEGRAVLDFSEWDRHRQEIRELGETIREGEMPPFSYVILHPGARLTEAEKEDLSAGLTATVRADPPGG